MYKVVIMRCFITPEVVKEVRIYRRILTLNTRANPKPDIFTTADVVFASLLYSSNPVSRNTIMHFSLDYSA